jgi:Uma2 family endonuclease
MTTYPFRTRRWTRKEYHKLDELGVLQEDEPVELIDGQIIVAERKTPPHAAVVHLTADALRRAFGEGWLVIQQDPIALDEDSEPEPDVAVALGGPRDYVADHAARPVLVVEVAETSLDLDRRYKGSAYARAGLSDYWVVNLLDWQVEVYRRPAVDATAELGWRYLDHTIVGPGGTITPLARLDVTVAVADIFPDQLRRLRRQQRSS